MAAAPRAMLFCPPHAPVPLGPGARVVVGRSRRCGLRLPVADTSRRHAEFVEDGGRYLVRDLGSTNGTFVNGEQIRDRVLEPGDRIQIGNETIAFCHMEGGLDSAGQAHSDEKTILYERPAHADVFQGNLAEIPTFAVLQVLEMGRKTGALHVEAVEGGGRLWLAEGAPIHAATKSQCGFDAAVSIVNCDTGRFNFECDAQAPERTIQASVTELLLEASKILDEADLVDS